MGEVVFYVVIFSSVGLVFVVLFGLALLNIIEKEYDYLELENKQIRVEKRLKDMEYIQLSQQIRPHFMFNALNGMISLARLGRVETLISSMESFSKFFRHHYKSKKALIAFETELDHTNHYLRIQKMRFGDRLVVSYDLDPRARETRIPPYMLQTFVENAFKHGLEKRSGERRLDIGLVREGDWVRVYVKDNGESLEAPVSFGTGLTNIQKRMDLLFDVYTELKLERVDGMTVVQAYLPYTPEGQV